MRETDAYSPNMTLSTFVHIRRARRQKTTTMASYATVPAADLESEATLLNSKPKAKTSLLIGGVAAAAFVLGALSMTALRTSPSVRSAAFHADTGRTDPQQIILFGSKERNGTI